MIMSHSSHGVQDQGLRLKKWNKDLRDTHMTQRKQSLDLSLHRSPVKKKALILWYGGWRLPTLKPLPSTKMIVFFRVMLLKGCTGAGCLPQLDPDTHTESAVPLYGLCKGREPKQLWPFSQWKGPGNVESNRSPCQKSVWFIHGL